MKIQLDTTNKTVKIEENIKVNGFKIIWKEKEFILGVMEEDIKDNILMIKI